MDSGMFPAAPLAKVDGPKCRGDGSTLGVGSSRERRLSVEKVFLHRKGKKWIWRESGYLFDCGNMGEKCKRVGERCKKGWVHLRLKKMKERKGKERDGSTVWNMAH
jgi:hypothetical protein